MSPLQRSPPWPLHLSKFLSVPLILFSWATFVSFVAFVTIGNHARVYFLSSFTRMKAWAMYALSSNVWPIVCIQKNPCQLNACCCLRATLPWRKPLYLLQGHCGVSESQQLLIKKKKAPTLSCLLSCMCVCVCVSLSGAGWQGGGCQLEGRGKD